MGGFFFTFTSGFFSLCLKFYNIKIYVKKTTTTKSNYKTAALAGDITLSHEGDSHADKPGTILLKHYLK